MPQRPLPSAVPLVYTIEREGEVWVNTNGETDRTHQCGRLGGDRFLYRALIETTDLDDHGFVIDNNVLHAYFLVRWAAEPVAIFPSCESIATEAVHAFRRLCRGARRVAVTIAGGHHARLTATWTRE